MTDRQAGKRLRRYVLAAAADRNIHTIIQLAEAAGVGRDTIQVWFRGTRAPSAAAGEKVARAIGRTYKDLLNARDGEPTSEPTRRLADEDVQRIAQETAAIVLRELGRKSGDRARGRSGRA